MCCNIEDFSQDWKPEPLLKRGFIAAYVQSSQPECLGGFGWTSDYEQSRKEIKQAFDLISKKYSIDKKNVILGGYSGGAMASLNVLMNNTIDVKGIVALCPNEVDDCTDENMKKAADRGRRIVLLEGDKSGKIPFQDQLMESAEKCNLSAKYMINKGVGHEVPEDFDRMINEAVDFILES